MIQDVFKPASLSEAVRLHKEEAAPYLAGGTYVNWAGSGIRPEKVVLLEGLLPDEVRQKEGRMEIGAGITLQALVDTPAVPEPLRRAAGFVYSRCIRTMATLGGAIGANRTDSSVIPALIALKARIRTAEGTEMPVEDYLDQGAEGLIAWVVLSEVAEACVVDRAVLSAAAYPSVTLAVRVGKDEAVIAVGCVADRVVRLTTVEKRILSGALATEEEVFEAVYAAVDPPDGLKESRAYRKYIAAVKVARAVMECKGLAS